MSALTYADVCDFVQGPLVENGFRPVFDPGPPSVEGLLKLAPGAMIFLTVGGGAGLSKEYAFDRPFITARIVGPQRDYEAAEALALALDAALLRADSSGMVGKSYSLYITRTGGRPTLLLRDTADRYHFTVSYIAEAESGL